MSQIFGLTAILSAIGAVGAISVGEFGIGISLTWAAFCATILFGICFIKELLP